MEQVDANLTPRHTATCAELAHLLDDLWFQIYPCDRERISLERRIGADEHFDEGVALVSR